MKDTLKITFVLGLVILISGMSFSQTNLKLQNKFVIVLDIQQEFTENYLKDNYAKKLIDSVNFVIENTLAERIIYVADSTVPKVLNVSFKGIWVDTAYGNRNLDEKLNLVNDNIFTKNGGNAFSSKELIHFLENNDAKEIVVVGLIAEGCVKETLLGGLEAGYDMYAIPEAIVGKSDRSKNRTMKKLRNMGIKLLNFQ